MKTTKLRYLIAQIFWAEMPFSLRQLEGTDKAVAFDRFVEPMGDGQRNVIVNAEKLVVSAFPLNLPEIHWFLCQYHFFKFTLRANLSVNMGSLLRVRLSNTRMVISWTLMLQLGKPLALGFKKNVSCLYLSVVEAKVLRPDFMQTRPCVAWGCYLWTAECSALPPGDGPLRTEVKFTPFQTELGPEKVVRCSVF